MEKNGVIYNRLLGIIVNPTFSRIYFARPDDLRVQDLLQSPSEALETAYLNGGLGFTKREEQTLDTENMSFDDLGLEADSRYRIHPHRTKEEAWDAASEDSPTLRVSEDKKTRSALSSFASEAPNQYPVGQDPLDLPEVVVEVGDKLEEMSDALAHEGGSSWEQDTHAPKQETGVFQSRDSIVSDIAHALEMTTNKLSFFDRKGQVNAEAFFDLFRVRYFSPEHIILEVKKVRSDIPLSFPREGGHVEKNEHGKTPPLKEGDLLVLKQLRFRPRGQSEVSSTWKARIFDESYYGGNVDRFVRDPKKDRFESNY